MKILNVEHCDCEKCFQHITFYKLVENPGHTELWKARCINNCTNILFYVPCDESVLEYYEQTKTSGNES